VQSVSRWRSALVAVLHGAVVASLASALAGGGCAHEQGAAEDAGLDRAQDIPTEASVDSTGDGDPPIPDGLPPGWVRFDGYDKRCAQFIPGPTAAMPAPIVWQPCDVDGGGLNCRKMQKPPDEVPDLNFVGTTLSDGRVLLSFSRSAQKLGRYYIIAEADGPVRHAILQTRPQISCRFADYKIFRDRYVYRVETGDTPYGGGGLAGQIDMPAPSVVFKYSPELRHNLSVSPLGIADYNDSFRFQLHDWTTGISTGFGEPDGPHIGHRPMDDAVFWTPTVAGIKKTRVYTKEGGVRDFLSANTADTAYADIGGDGIDLVWSRASGLPSDGGPYSTIEIYSAPYTTDPSKLAPRRIRSEREPVFATRPFVVGCGLGARFNGFDLRLVRLATGDSWLLPGSAGWRSPIIVTCDELFLFAYVANVPTIARIRIDSLGPSIPPD
jgi:hypothetical protein